MRLKEEMVTNGFPCCGHCGFPCPCATDQHTTRCAVCVTEFLVMSGFTIAQAHKLEREGKI